MCINTYRNISQSEKIKIFQGERPRLFSIMRLKKKKKPNTKAHHCDISEN